MKKMVCEICGSQRIQKQNGVFACQECGTEYSLDEAKKLLQEVEAINDLSLPNEKENESQSNNGEKLLAILYAWAKLIQSIPKDLNLWTGYGLETFWKKSPTKSDFLTRLHHLSDNIPDLFPKIVESDLIPIVFGYHHPEKLEAIIAKTSQREREYVVIRAFEFWKDSNVSFVFLGERREAYNFQTFLTSQIADADKEIKEFLDWFRKGRYDLRPKFADMLGLGSTWDCDFNFESSAISVFYFWDNYCPKTTQYFYNIHQAPVTINIGTFFHPCYVEKHTPVSDCKIDLPRLMSKSTKYVKAFVKEHNERMDYYEQHYDEVCSYLEEILDKEKILEKELFLSYDERNLESIMQMINLVETGRASSAKEMLNLFDTHQFREETLTEARFINEKLGAIEKQLKDNAHKIDELNSNLMSSIIGIDEIGLKMNAISSGLKKISRNTFITMWNTL